jgi:small subunit ribosomal protein S4e
MHQKRQAVSKKIPIPRKGTKYVARSRMDLQNSVPLVVAVRDMLKLARTAKEVKKMIKQKLLKINGKEVKDYRASLRLFNILEAGKTYALTITKTGRLSLEETKEKNRVCKVIDKTLLKGNKIQLNLHDGSNVIAKEKINTYDSVYLDSSNKILKHVQLEKGKACLIISGKYLGEKGKIESINEKITVSLEDKEFSAQLEKRSVVAL